MRDLNEIFDFVEPSNDNTSVYSHRIYELLLRAATEFESNCKGILKANGYTGPREGLVCKRLFQNFRCRQAF